MAFNPASYLLGIRGGQAANPFNILSNSIHSGANAGNALMRLLYGPQMYQDQHANAQLKNDLMHSHIQALLNPQSQSTDYQVVPTQTGYMRVNRLTGQVSPLESNGQNLMPNKSGMAINSLPGGGFSITTGGAIPTPNGTQTQYDASGQPVAPQDGLQRTPASPHSKFSTGGSTVYDPKTGGFVSTPTAQNAGKMQQSAINESPALSSLFRSTQDITPYVGLMNTKIPNYLASLVGMESPGYDKYRAATTTGLPHVADNLLSINGLNKTNELYKNMLDSVEPKWDDNSHIYTRRIATTIAEALIRQKKYNQIMKYGIPLSNDNPSEISKDAAKRKQLIDTIQSGLMSGNAPSTASTIERSQHSTNIPSGIDLNSIDAELAKRGSS
jgi:hypothetical protein